MKTIICPTDFSATSLNACEYAARLCKDIDANLLLLNVMHVPVADLNGAVTVLEGMMDEQREKVEKKLVQLQLELEEEFDVSVSFFAEFGLAKDVISSHSKKKSTTLIVMGTNGESDMMDKLLGTVSLAVSKNSECPVLIVSKEDSYTGLQNIGFANDNEERLDSHLAMLNMILDKNSGLIHLISVAADKEEDEYEVEVVDTIDNLKTVCVWSDEIWKGLRRYSKDSKLDMIAIKRHHRNFFEELFHKSISREILNHSAIPVLIFN